MPAGAVALRPLRVPLPLLVTVTTLDVTSPGFMPTAILFKSVTGIGFAGTKFR